MQIVEETFELDSLTVQDDARESGSEWKWYHFLPIAAAAIYIFSPIFVWQLGLPGAVKFLGDVIVIAMIGLAIGRMILIDHIPGAFLVILALTIIGALVAAFEGQ